MLEESRSIFAVGQVQSKPDRDGEFVPRHRQLTESPPWIAILPWGATEAHNWHLLGFDHERFTYPFQGLDQRLTGVEAARVVTEILA